MAETTTAGFTPYSIYWQNEPVQVSYPAWPPPPVCTCEATWDHNIWTHWYRLLTVSKKIWRIV